MVAKAASRLPVILYSLLIAALAGYPAMADVYLGDIVGGGDGSGNAPADNIGISADDGTFQTTHQNGNIANTGDNPQAVDDSVSKYIDSVFIMDTPSMAINSAGVVFDFPAGDENPVTWNHIIKDRTHDVDKGFNDIFMSGVTYLTGLGIHASAGITFDLDAIRADQADPNDVAYFNSVMGIDRCAGNINTYIIFSDDIQILEDPPVFRGNYTGNRGGPVQLFIPGEAKYMTLAVGDANDGIGCDHGVFAELRLQRAPPVLVTRNIQDAFLPGEEITIELDVLELKEVPTLEIRERVPRGFLASAPTGGGTIETDAAGRQTLVWNFTGGVVSQLLTYQVLVPNPYPNSTFKGGQTVAGGETNFILGDQSFTGGSEGFASEALVITLKQPGAACGDTDAPGLAALRQDYLTDGDALSEITVAPAQGESVSPDFMGASPSTGATTNTSLTWTRMIGQAGGWFQLNSCDQCMSYVAFYAVVPPGPPIQVRVGSASDDSEQILVDGKEVWVNNVARGAGSARVQDRSGPFDLAPGKHLVMQKVFEGCGGFDSAIRLEDEDGNPLLLQFTLDPAGYPVGTAFVLRDVPDSLDVGEAAKVTLKLRMKEATEGAAIEENVPAGFTISAVSDGGAIQGQKITWNIAGALSSRDLSYQVTVPAGAIDAAFQGSATLGGRGGAILGDQSFSRGIMNQAGFIKHWLALGPLDTFGLWQGDLLNPNGNFEGPSATPENGDIRLDFLTDGTITEKNIRPFDGMRITPAYTGNGTTGALSVGLDPLTLKACAPTSATWEAVVTPAGTFDNTAYFGEDINSHATYAACYVTNNTGSPLSTNIAINSDDAFIAFLDGTEAVVYEPDPCSAAACGRGYGAEDSVMEVMPVTLPPGESFLLTRVHDGAGGSGHRLRFQDGTGNPVLPPALTVSLRSSASPAPVYVRRILSSDAYKFPEQITVTLRVEAGGTHNVSIKEVLPLGFGAGNISDGGVEAAGQVSWTLNGVSGTRDVTYRLTPGDCPGGGSFCGSEYTVDAGATHALRGDAAFRRETRTTDDLGTWDVRDIGYVGGGTQRVEAHDVDVTGKGSGVKLTKDEFRFISLPRSGDFEVSARIDCFEDLGGAGQGGLMVRDTFDQFSAHVFFALSSTVPDGGGAGTLKGTLRRETSKTRTSAPVTISDKDVLTLPLHLKIKRAAGKISLQRSPDGVTFSEVATRDIGIGTTQVNLRNDTLAGLAVTGGGTGAMRVDYRQVSGPEFPDASQRPNAPRNLAAVKGNRKVDLSWDEPAPGGLAFTGYAVLRDGVKVADLPLAPRSYADGGLVNGTRYCYAVQATQGAVRSPSSNEACATPEGVVGPQFRRGDTDANGSIELTDAVKLLNWLFLGQAKPECVDAADADDNGDADISDAIANLNYQFLGAVAPAAPGPINCGLDVNQESPDLGCDVSCR